MTTALVVIVVLAAWVSIGLVLAVVMGRRGHAPATWGLVGMFLGPLAVPVALAAGRPHAEGEAAIPAHAPAVPGRLDVLVGIDGSPPAATALARAVELFGDGIGRLSLVYVASADAAADPALMVKEEANGRRALAAARRAIPGRPTEEYVVAGRPAAVLSRLAIGGGYDLVVIGPRGHGMSPRLFGSVATELAASSAVPVLVGGQQPPPATESARNAGPIMATIQL